MQLLLDRGADMDLQNRNGVTALIAAVKYEDPELAMMLIQAGASMDIRDRKGRRAADFAMEVDACRRRWRRSLAPARPSRSRRARAAHTRTARWCRLRGGARAAGRGCKGDNQKVKEQLKSSAAVNLEDEDGTPRSFAAEEQPLIVETLIEAGAALDPRTRMASALMVAIRCIDIDSIKLRRRRGQPT